jgi:acyl carrier protein
MSDIQRLFSAADIKVPLSKLEASVPLRQQGIDSLDMANLLFQLEQSSGNPISPEESSQLATLGDIVRYIADARARGAWTE